MILSRQVNQERLPKLSALPDDELVRGCLQISIHRMNDTKMLLDRAYVDIFDVLVAAVVTETLRPRVCVAFVSGTCKNKSYMISEEGVIAVKSPREIGMRKSGIIIGMPRTTRY